MNTSQTGIGTFLLQTCCLRCLLPPWTPPVTQQRQPETVTLLLLATPPSTSSRRLPILPLTSRNSTPSLSSPIHCFPSCSHPVTPELHYPSGSGLFTPPLPPAAQVILHRVAKGTLQKRPSGFPHPPKMGPNSSKALLSWSLTPSSAPSFPAIHLALWVSVTLSSLMCLEGSWHSAHCAHA